MPDLDKLYEKADKYLQRQKFEAAIDTYQEILRYEPHDEEALINLGDLNLKINHPGEALRYQSQLADHYVRRGDVPKAIAACRKVLKLSPQDVGTLIKLAGLLERNQKTGEALDAYREAAGHLRRLELRAQVLECLIHIVELDPSSLEEQVELAELSSRSGQMQVAMQALLRAVQLAESAQDESRWEKLVVQAHALDPSNESASVAFTRLCFKHGDSAQAIKTIEPLLAKKPDDLEVLELACKGYLGSGDYAQAQPLCRKLYLASPQRVDLILKLLEGLVRSGAVRQALGMLSELKDRLFDQGKRNEFLKILETIYHSDESNLEVLETLCNAYNEMNREDGLRRSLSRLFNLYLTTENYNKAADALERILDVEPYGAGHNDRLMSLEGHIDSTWYKSIHARLQPPSGRTAPAVNARAAATDEADSLEDLLIEGEMYHQYQLAAKLTETLKKIDRLFPGAHEKNQKLSELYDAAGYTPKYKAPQAAALAPTPQPDGVTAATESIQSLHDVRKISEITANIYRESTPQGVLQVAVDEIGRAMNASRCWGAVGSPDTPPALMAEYCSPLASPSDPTAATRLFAFLIEQTASRPEGFSAENAARAALLFEVGAEIQRLGIRSLLALPLIDKDAAAGLLLVEQCDSPRSWSAGEALLLKSVGTQLVIAINNTKLRRLARSLAGTDPDTGLLPRSVYLECLLSEARRSKERSQPLSVCLLEPEGPQVLMKSLGDAGVRSFVLQLGKALAPVLRQNDIAIRYSPLSVAVVFPDTALPQAGFAVEKVRRVLTQVRVNNFGADNFCAAVCDVPLGADFDVVDGVTEVINRLESCLARAHKEGGDRILISRFSV